MIYIAHRRKDGIQQPLQEHLENVSKMAAEFAKSFHAQKDAGLAGLYHDIGKYSTAGQQRMHDPEHTVKVDHSTAGAQAVACFSTSASFAIAGHHAGLPDMGTKFSTPDGSELLSRLKKVLSGNLDYTRCWEEIPAINHTQMPFMPLWINQKESFSSQAYVRMLFSCLVDADYLDTQAFMNGRAETRSGQADSINALNQKFQAFVNQLLSHPSNELNQLRSRILQCCIDAGGKESGIYTLTVPTGGGKTLSSMAYALKHAVTHEKKRIIYVVPYTSIIEQNAEVYKQIFGEKNVLEHHSNSVFWRKEGDDSETEALAAENWDAPIIITTAVQFFESLFSCRPSKCRKLHNIADSVVIFDEAQMIPLPFLIPCVAAISELVVHYGVNALLCTATQPALNGMFLKYAGREPEEICNREIRENQLFQRTGYCIESNKWTEEELAEKIKRNAQVLCIVNSKASARQVFDLLPADGTGYHLSTNMTPRHRKRVIHEIREKLREGLPCRVVSTSLIEAGVDVDFPSVYRELSGLDSILQAGGRCNREGKRPSEQSVVIVFRLNRKAPKQFEQQIAATEHVFLQETTVQAERSVSSYFRFLMDLKGNEQLDEQKIMEYSKKYAFRQIDQHFHLIDDDTISVYIPNQLNDMDIELLRCGQESRQVMRRLGMDAVNVYLPNYHKLLEAGNLEITKKGYAILKEMKLYDAEKGLCLNVIEPGNAIFL